MQSKAPASLSRGLPSLRVERRGPPERRPTFHTRHRQQKDEVPQRTSTFGAHLLAQDGVQAAAPGAGPRAGLAGSGLPGSALPFADPVHALGELPTPPAPQPGAVELAGVGARSQLRVNGVSGIPQQP